MKFHLYLPFASAMNVPLVRKRWAIHSSRICITNEHRGLGAPAVFERLEFAPGRSRPSFGMRERTFANAPQDRSSRMRRNVDRTSLIS